MLYLQSASRGSSEQQNGQRQRWMIRKRQWNGGWRSEGSEQSSFYLASDRYEGHRHTSSKDHMILSPLFLQYSIFIFRVTEAQKQLISTFSDRPMKMPLQETYLLAGVHTAPCYWSIDFKSVQKRKNMYLLFCQVNHLLMRCCMCAAAVSKAICWDFCLKNSVSEIHSSEWQFRLFSCWMYNA